MSIVNNNIHYLHSKHFISNGFLTALKKYQQNSNNNYCTELSHCIEHISHQKVNNIAYFDSNKDTECCVFENNFTINDYKDYLEFLNKACCHNEKMWVLESRKLKYNHDENTRHQIRDNVIICHNNIQYIIDEMVHSLNMGNTFFDYFQKYAPHYLSPFE